MKKEKGVKTLLVLSVVLFSHAVCADAPKWDNAVIEGRLPGDRVFFGPGEEMRFSLMLKGVEGKIPDGVYFIDWKREGDDGKFEKGRVPAKVGVPFEVVTSLDDPGFVTVEANLVDKTGRRVKKKHRWEPRVFFKGGAGVMPRRIRSLPEPVDYDSFWNKLTGALDKVPIRGELTQVPCPNDPKLEVYAFKVDCVGPRPATGYLTIPKGAAPKSLRISVGFPGATHDPQLAPKGGPHDRINVTVNSHGYELGKDAEYYKAFFKSVEPRGHYYGFDPEENRFATNSYFYCMMQRNIRAIQYLMTLPHWNGKELSISGGSMGGFQAILAAAHIPQVTSVFTGDTWGLDWGGENIGRLRATFRPQWDRELAYYDPCFAAKRIRCKVTVGTAGLGDYVSPPSGIVAMYNNFKGPKEITFVQGWTHGWHPTDTPRKTFKGELPDPKSERPVDPVTYIEGEIAKGVKNVVLPKGRYVLERLPGRKPYLVLKGLRDVTIDFGGSEFYGTIQTRMIDVSFCTNVTLKNLEVDYGELAWTQGKIVSCDTNGTWIVDICKGYPVQERTPAESCWPVQAYDGDTLECVNHMRMGAGLKIERIGSRRYRVSGGVDRKGKKGDYCVFTLTEFRRNVDWNAVSISECFKCRFENIKLWTTPRGAAFNATWGGANEFIGCSINRRAPETDLVKRDVKRLRSGNHDAYMNRCARIGPRIENCVAKYHCDDCVNISGFYNVVMSVKGNVVRVLTTSERRLEAGATAQLMAEDGRHLPDVRVVSYESAGAATKEEMTQLEKFGFHPSYVPNIKKAFTVVLDRPVDGIGAGSMLAMNTQMGNGFVVRNCDFGHSRARGLLIKGSNGLIEGNRMERLGSIGIQVCQEYFWMEAGCSRDVMIRNNEMIDCGGAGIYVAGGNLLNKPPPVDSHFDITIITNKVRGSRDGIGVWGCTRLTIKGNDVASDNPDNALIIRNCKNVKRD